MPRHLYSPHTTFLRQSGHSFEIATALCSLLIGQGYEAYVVSGYAIKDVTLRIMCRVVCPYPPTSEEETKEEAIEEDEKYKIVTPKGLESKFLAMMKQRELDQLKEEEEKQAQLELEKIMEEEKRHFDELEGRRIHAWILLGAGGRNNEPMVFIEPSTGMSHPLETDLYCGIESLWNNENYWVNLQDCSHGLNKLNYDLTDTTNWEHLLVGEPIKWRQQKAAEIGDEDIDDMFDEKHLDVPYPWSTKINIPNEVLKRRFPEGSKVTQYKRTLVEEYAPYVLDDGLVQKITRYTDFNCTIVESVEEKYENRHDKLIRTIFDTKTNRMTEYFCPGREDSVVKHIYYKTGDDDMEIKRIIFFNSKARFDGLSMIEIDANLLTEHYCDREDKLYYRQVVYDRVMSSLNEANRRPIQRIVQKFTRNEDISAYNDLSRREFNIKDREIYLKYHYGKDNITASTRNFIKPPISEMGEGMTFRPELTTGYQAQIGAKPPRQLQLFLLLEQQLKDEKEVIDSIRDFENQISEFLLQRAHEMAFTKLDVSIYNREQNQSYRERMLEQEEKQRLYKEKEVEEEVDYLSPYLARLGNPSYLNYKQALEVKYQCLTEFKELLVNRANDIQKQFEITSEKAQVMQLWYTENHENLTSDEEANYFKEVNDLIFFLRTLEIRLSRHKELSYLRYEAMEEYVNNHPMLEALNE
ncbi:hypothetical protein GWI33_005555 [Rhynchophorus ferrugineus]|uniref:Dynein regulatory complex subunit 7 n=1 Tax=Rhynchophorus ferrugineus TaxID=354439 RepID=A0A834ILF7_RHYFE|nr:hypothetical protein GWI33_005555 [Rhynchophorus ferrugineus]